MRARTSHTIIAALLAGIGCISAPTPGEPAPAGSTSSEARPVATVMATATEPASPVPTPLVAPAPTVMAAATDAAPPGFPAVDEFQDTTSACEALVPRLVEREELRGPILDWCLERAYRSSRSGHPRARSRIDGTWIHDRDRPSARAFYRTGINAGYLDPDTCEHHAVDRKIRRTRKAREFTSHWPYGTHCDRSRGDGMCTPRSPGHMLPTIAQRWHSHDPDYERFGTRGPIDLSLWVAVRYLGGCFPPEALDRFDVSAAATIERTEDLCLRLERKVGSRVKRNRARAHRLPVVCENIHDIRTVWHPRFWYHRLPEALSSR